MSFAEANNTRKRVELYFQKIQLLFLKTVEHFYRLINTKSQTMRKKFFKRSKNKFNTLCQLNKKAHKEIIMVHLIQRPCPTFARLLGNRHCYTAKPLANCYHWNTIVVIVGEALSYSIFLAYFASLNEVALLHGYSIENFMQIVFLS